jgi:hypothetical protein
MSIVKENMGWLEHTYDKVGNQISLQAVGYKKVSVERKSNPFHSKNKAILSLNVTNHGLSDQIHDDIKIRLDNKNIRVHYNGRKDGNMESSEILAHA